MLGNLISHQCGPRDFQHGSHLIVEFDLFLLGDFSGDPMDNFNLAFQFFRKSNQRHHDFGTNLDFLFLNFGGCLKYGASLHFTDLRVNHSQTATPMPQHGIELMELIDALVDHLVADPHFTCQLPDEAALVWQKLMQGWIQQPNSRRTSIQCFEDSDEILFLER